MSKSFIPYGRQQINEQDIAAVCETLRSDWLTTGPRVAEFEERVAGFVGARHGIAVSSGTAALHAAMQGIGVGPGDEVIVPAMTFAATANCVLYQGATPVFCDVDADTLLIDPVEVEARITNRTKAVIAVDYAGQPCDYKALRRLAGRHDLALVADACHSLGGLDQEGRVGSLADLTVFSFHPVKHITTGEGGMVVTDNGEAAGRMRRFRNHGIATDHRQRETLGTWQYEMVELGYNYRITDFQCSLGLSQLARLPGWLDRRQAMARLYDREFVGHDPVKPLAVRPGISHAYHLYVVRLADAATRGRMFQAMRDQGIGVNVHYLPVHLHPYYRHRFGLGPGLCPRAEAAYERILSLPMHAGLTDAEGKRVAGALLDSLESC